MPLFFWFGRGFGPRGFGWGRWRRVFRRLRVRPLLFSCGFGPGFGPYGGAGAPPRGAQRLLGKRCSSSRSAGGAGPPLAPPAGPRPSPVRPAPPSGAGPPLAPPVSSRRGPSSWPRSVPSFAGSGRVYGCVGSGPVYGSVRRCRFLSAPPAPPAPAPPVLLPPKPRGAPPAPPAAPPWRPRKPAGPPRGAFPAFSFAVFAVLMLRYFRGFQQPPQFDGLPFPVW